MVPLLFLFPGKKKKSSQLEKSKVCWDLCALPALGWSWLPARVTSCFLCFWEVRLRASGDPQVFPVSQPPCLHQRPRHSLISTLHPYSRLPLLMEVSRNSVKTLLTVFLPGHLRGRRCLPEHKGESRPDPFCPSSTSELRTCLGGPRRRGKSSHRPQLCRMVT